MSNFNKYARKVDEIAKAAFEEYHKAEKTLAAAEEQAKKYPQRFGMVDAQYAAKSARAQADLLEAREAMNTAKYTFENHKNELATIRKNLAAELNDAYSVNPAELDSNTLELLKSGIMTSFEYEKLMNDAFTAGNHTMIRIITKYAADAAYAIAKENGNEAPEAKALRMISYMGRNDSGKQYLDAYDYISDVFNRCIKNPPLIAKWDELTSAVIEKF